MSTKQKQKQKQQEQEKQQGQERQGPERQVPEQQVQEQQGQEQQGQEQQQQLREVLVLGSHIKQGGVVVKDILETGQYGVRLLVQDLDNPKARKLKELGAKLYQGDPLNKKSLMDAMKGVHYVFFVQDFWEIGKDKEIEEGYNIIEVAKELGVQHLVYSSVSGADKNTGIPYLENKLHIEQKLIKSGLPYTILRHVSLMENYLMPEVKEGIEKGVFKTPLKPETKLQLISVKDIGKFVLHAYETPDIHKGQINEIAADELTQAEIAKMLNCKYEYLDISKLQKDEQGLYQWLDTVGYNVDIEKCKKCCPELIDFKTFANKKFASRCKPEEQKHRV